jgi:signal transduction histidine kinase
VRRGDTTESLEFGLRATPIVLEDRRFLVTCLHDISDAKRRFALEQVFFHDVLNTLTALVGHSRLLKDPAVAEDRGMIIDRTVFLAQRLSREVMGQRVLVEAESGQLELDRLPVAVAELVERVVEVFAGHPVAEKKSIEVQRVTPKATIVTDAALLERVLVNMVKNALEATGNGGKVRLWCDADAGSCTFSVWNEGEIPREIAVQIFRRSFSTKSRRGRGLGTYAMKLLGERYLGGRVSFTSTVEEGTVFSITLPLAPPDG